MHKDSKTHWQPSDPIRCHSCTARVTKEKSLRNNGMEVRDGAVIAVRPDRAMWHAMTNPKVTYLDGRDEMTIAGRIVRLDPEDTDTGTAAEEDR